MQYIPHVSFSGVPIFFKVYVCVRVCVYLRNSRLGRIVVTFKNFKVIFFTNNFSQTHFSLDFEA